MSVRRNTLNVLVAAMLIGTGSAQAGGLGIHIGGDVGKFLKKAEREATNGVENVGEAVEVVAKSPERMAKNVVESVERAGDQLKEGDVLAALGTAAGAQLKAQENTALQSAQESSALRMAGGVAASTFGGPAGGAAYSGWYAGRTTGSLEEGLKAGAISYGVSVASGAASAPEASSVGDTMAKAMANGVIAGAGTQLAGGEFDDGFAQGAATSLAYDAYVAYTGRAPDPTPADKPAVAKGTSCGSVVGDCFVVENANDMRAVPHDYNHIGKQSLTPGESGWMYEGSDFMKAVNEMPGMNAMAFGHDVFALDYAQTSEALNVGTIPPAVVVTYTALGANRDQEILRTVTESTTERDEEKADE